MGKFFDFSVNTGSYNMEFDEYNLDEAIKKNETCPILRLYGWKPACVSLGRNQKNDVDVDFCNKNGIDIVRRATGGRALLHKDELTYSFICPTSYLKNGESVISSYKEISEALILGMEDFGLDINFPEDKKAKTSAKYCMLLSTGADLSYKNRKFIGSAQVRKSGYILQHGSILIDIDFDLIKKIFHEPVDAHEIFFLKELDKKILMKELVISVKKGFEQKFDEKFV